MVVAGGLYEVRLWLTGLMLQGLGFLRVAEEHRSYFATASLIPLKARSVADWILTVDLEESKSPTA